MNSMGNRNWTKLLEAAGSKAVSHPRFEHQMTRRKLIAEMVLTALTEGTIYFSNGTQAQIGSKEWLEFTRWLYTHIDGPAPSKVQLSTPAGESLKVEDVTLDNAERLRRVAALFDAARSRAAGLSANNGQAQPNGVHGTSLADLRA